MKLIDVQQGSHEWLMARVGVPTASELDNLIHLAADRKKKGKVPAKALWKLRTGEMPKTFIAKKLAERWIGEPIHTWSGGAMTQGSILEDEALPWFAFEFDVTLERPGFITTDAGDFGCSPDGWIAANKSGVEIKAPEIHTHTKWLLAGVLPPEHAAQVQGSMFVTGAERWTFVSYCRRMPPLVLTVERDADAQDAIADAIKLFGESFAEGWAELVARNGGAEPSRAWVAEELIEENISF